MFTASNGYRVEQRNGSLYVGSPGGEEPRLVVSNPAFVSALREYVEAENR